MLSFIYSTPDPEGACARSTMGLAKDLRWLADGLADPNGARGQKC